MSATPLSERQLAVHLGKFLEYAEKRRDERVFGFHVIRPWSGPNQIDVNGTAIDVTQCGSNLAVREALAERTDDDPPLALLTSCRDDDLEDDIRARLAKRRLQRFDDWDAVLHQFRAVRPDPRLTRYPWIAELLVESAPRDGYPAVPSGVLDLDRVIGFLLRDRLGFEDARPDLRTVIHWTLDTAALVRFGAEREELREALPGWIADSAGATGRRLIDCALAGHGTDALAIGLVLDALLAAQADPATPIEAGDVERAFVRLEPFVGGRPFASAEAEPWARAAIDLLRAGERIDPQRQREVLARADALLDTVHAPTAAVASDFLPSGLDQRAERLADAIRAAVETTGAAQLAAVDAATARFTQHDRIKSTARPIRATMARRLLHWLAARVESKVSAAFADSVRDYEMQGGFVDCARAAVVRGDTFAPLAKAYDDLLARVLVVREEENRRFAEQLAAWTKAGSTSDRTMPAESVLDRIVAPIAERAHVLLVVLDGMSQAVFRELMEDIEAAGWVGYRPEASGDEGTVGPLPPVIAALPTVTSVARTSLLRGALSQGSSGDEKAGFAAYPALLAASTKKYAPKLLHEGDIGRANALPDKIRRELEGERRVFGVVVNAIDDHLSKGDQIDVDWNLRTIHPLADLLEAARVRKRVVILTADHGHLPDRDTMLVRHDGSDARYRPATSPPGEGEVLLEGPRVVAGEGRVVAAWSERLRYGKQQAGYHGGASPQEVVVPITVIAPAGTPISGWVEVPFERPTWWETESLAQARRAAAAATAAKPTKKSVPYEPPKPKGSLPFKTATEVTDQSADEATPPWIVALLASETYIAQRQSAARVMRSDEPILRLLVALDQSGGTATRKSVSKALAIPDVRLAGFLEAARRVLNLDGYAVLELDDESDRVTLHRDLLLTQFGIEIEM